MQLAEFIRRLVPVKCVECGDRVSILTLFTGRFCQSCRVARRASRVAADNIYNDVLTRASLGRLDVESDSAMLTEAARKARLNPDQSLKRHTELVRKYALAVLADDVVTETEEGRIVTLGSALGISPEIWRRSLEDVGHKLAIASVNAGRLPVLEESHLIPKKNEVVHAEFVAALMKETAILSIEVVTADSASGS